MAVTMVTDGLTLAYVWLSSSSDASLQMQSVTVTHAHLSPCSGDH